MYNYIDPFKQDLVELQPVLTTVFCKVMQQLLTTESFTFITSTERIHVSQHVFMTRRPSMQCTLISPKHLPVITVSDEIICETSISLGVRRFQRVSPHQPPPPAVPSRIRLHFAIYGNVLPAKIQYNSLIFIRCPSEECYLFQSFLRAVVKLMGYPLNLTSLTSLYTLTSIMPLYLSPRYPLWLISLTVEPPIIISSPLIFWPFSPLSRPSTHRILVPCHPSSSYLENGIRPLKRRRVSAGMVAGFIG